MARSAKQSIFEVLTEATDISRKNRESADDFKVRLMEAASEMPDDKYNDLPAEVTDCVSDWLRAYNGKDGHKKGTVLAIPGFEEDEPKAEPKARGRERVTRDEEEDAAEEKAPARRGRPAKAKEEDPEEKPAAKRGRPAAAKANGKAPAKAAARERAAPKERKQRETNRSGSVYKIKEFLIKKPNASVDDVLDAMASAKVACKQSTVTGIRSDFLNSLRVLADKGKLTGIAGYDD